MICNDCGVTFDEDEYGAICPNCGYNNSVDEEEFYEEEDDTEEEEEETVEDVQCQNCGGWYFIYEFEERRCPQCGYVNSDEEEMDSTEEDI